MSHDIRRLISIVEASQRLTEDKAFEEALWWVERWVSGSEDDPDWDDSWTTMTADEAFHYVAAKIKTNAKGPLYRALIVPKKLAAAIIAEKVLPTNHRAFQSFTTTEENTVEASFAIQSYTPRGQVRLVVEVYNPPILFALSDLKNTRIWLTLSDWHAQEEVIVDGRSPLPLSMAKTFTR